MELNQRGKVDFDLKENGDTKRRWQRAARLYSIYQLTGGDMSIYLHLGYHIGDSLTLPAWLVNNHRKIRAYENEANITLQTKPKKGGRKKRGR